MSRLQLTFAQIRATIQDLQNENNEFCARVKSLMTSQQELSTMWQGDANTAFNQAFEKDRSAWDVFATLIGSYITVLSQILQIYEQAERNNAEIAASRTGASGNISNIAVHIPTTQLLYGGPYCPPKFPVPPKIVIDPNWIKNNITRLYAAPNNLINRSIVDRNIEDVVNHFS